MKAMIFAAGLGTRMQHLTATRPKALVEIGGMPLLEIAIRRLKYFGCREIIVNIHYLGSQIREFLEEKNNFGLDIAISDETDQILDTGGGLKKAAWFFDQAPFLAVNVDIITSLDLAALYDAHLRERPIASLAVRHRESTRLLLFDETRQLCGWRNTQKKEQIVVRAAANTHPLAFSGVHVISPELFNFFPHGEKAFSIIDVYLAAAVHGRILAYTHDEDIWLDVGKPEQISKAEAVIAHIALG
ncbi:MAG: hypothetical protein RL386_399 [Bacteroidota bacterium]|jgi:NDP-sugar pyrophosphorylase family protein